MSDPRHPIDGGPARRATHPSDPDFDDEGDLPIVGDNDEDWDEDEAEDEEKDTK